MSQKKEARRKPRLFLLLTLQGITTGNVREDDKNCRKTRFILHFFTFYNCKSFAKLYLYQPLRWHHDNVPHPLPDEDRNGPRGASLSNGINLRQQNCIVFSRQLLKLRGDLKNAQTKGFFIN
jgi:hypothetical protein